jgi:thymidylate synthase
LNGAFGHRLYGPDHTRDQLAAVLQRIARDPAHRRTYATILREEDNFLQSREYPCAAGVQLFLRNGCLTWLTVMRAQQALTVLPYDAFLFMQLHQISASQLGTELAGNPGQHFCGLLDLLQVGPLHHGMGACPAQAKDDGWNTCRAQER